MPNRQAELVFAHCPRRGIGWQGPIWFAAGFATLLVMLGMIWFLAERVVVPSRQIYPGLLRPASDAIEIVLPAGIPLRSIQVRKGDNVVTGQTLATFDQELMEVELAQAKRTILTHRVERQCLLHDMRSSPTQTPMETDPDTDQLLELALRRCAELLNRGALEQDRVALGRKHVVAQLGTTAQQRQLLFKAQPQTPTQKLRQANAAVALRVIQNNLTARLDKLSLEARSTSLDREAKLLNRIETLSQQLDKALKRRALLEQYLDSPRLTAPEDGTILRTRPIPVGSAAHEPTGIIDLRNNDAVMYQASFTAPYHRAINLEPGTPVSVSMVTMGKRQKRLRGQISTVEDTVGNMVDVSIDLEESSALYLSDPRSGIALRGASTLSTISVILPDLNLSHTLAVGWRNVLAALGVHTRTTDT